MSWHPFETAPEGVEVMTKIDDENGVRNQTSLVRQGCLWFFPSRSMYVYYRPTHWQPLPPSQPANSPNGKDSA